MSKSENGFQTVHANGVVHLQNSLEVKEFQFPKGFDHHQSPVVSNPCYVFKYRIFIVVLTVAVTVIGEILTIPQRNVECLIDTGHQLTSAVNQLINESAIFATFLQILSSAILDISFIGICTYWLLYTRTFRFFCALLSFYGIRFVHLQLLQMRYPSGYYWSDPGVPSLVVKYGQLSDFFYSGHCGFLFLCALEWKRLGKRKMFFLMLFASFFQAFIVITFQIHYTIDVPGGFVYAHWIYRLVCDNEVKIDYYNKKFIDCIAALCGYSCNPQVVAKEVDVELKKSVSEL